MKKCKFYKNGNCVNNNDGICQKYKSKNDGLALRCSGYWSKDKIEHLKYFIDIFSGAMKKKWPKLYYIDLFSGPGKCIIREGLKEIDGTCLEAINLKNKFTKYFLIDKNPVCINSLKQRAKEKNSVEYYNEDCNLAIGNIIKKSISDNSLSLAVIDPDSLQFHFSSYKQLAKRKIDLIVNYPIASVERAVSAALIRKLNSKKLDKFHPGWKDIANKKTWGNSKEINIRNLCKNYIDMIKGLGYFSSPSLVIFKNIKNTSLYYLILFSKHERGIEFWEKKTKVFRARNPQKALFDI
ncbi:MAG TPA: three-Cys-motif partner protein TcmP [Candidatus Nealsonbacteria bacterium]|uniref:Three-Cys-motif partner protein TcmP n=1 Tax=marine sediment metagenome TaxID=412755 RepID=A0A0F9XT91_9ZZZZ|nr:three-Cys-motif partner protein TcmP [Candidatus Nealsonbacteria bacterium]HEB46304.1 three-Cys-motif partner protein TcmP [Candidatus Nealsonbacteria bacterium]